jgi:hypothetical protein
MSLTVEDVKAIACAIAVVNKHPDPMGYAADVANAWHPSPVNNLPDLNSAELNNS